jgi:hypothetical protein
MIDKGFGDRRATCMPQTTKEEIVLSTRRQDIADALADVETRDVISNEDLSENKVRDRRRRDDAIHVIAF